MALVYDEFEEYEYSSRVFKRPGLTTQDDYSGYNDHGLHSKMRMRASFKSEMSYPSQRRQRGHDLIVQRLALMGLERKDNFINDDEIDCDFPSPDDVFICKQEDVPLKPNTTRDCVRPSHTRHNTWSAREYPRQSTVRSHSRQHQQRHQQLNQQQKEQQNLEQQQTLQTVKDHNHHHQRSKSCRTRSRRPRERHFQERHEHRRRTLSVPSRSRPNSNRRNQSDNDDDEGFYLVRTFSTSAKGIVNRGDSIKKRPLSAQSSSGSGESGVSKHRTLSATSYDSSYGSADDNGLHQEPHTVLVMGNSGVGKTALIRQFMSSEYMGNKENAIEDGTLPSVSVLLDDVESTLELADVSDAEEVTSNCCADAFVVVFAVNDRDSFDDAIMCLHELRKRALLDRTATILVANKGDIVRGRDVEEEEAKVMAVRYGCKYIEVSAIINVRVDELLVGILKQIRMNSRRREKASKKSRSSKSTLCIMQDNGCIPPPRKIMGKLLGKHQYQFRSCDNLLVL